MENLDDVYMKDKLVAALKQVNRTVFDKFRDLSIDEFFDRPPGGWSPWDTLRHLVKSVNAVSGGALMPRFALGIAFGKNSNERSRRFAEVRDDYLRHLNRGANAGRYSPSLKPVPATQKEAETERHHAMRQWKKAAKRLARILNRWTNSELDRYLMPHPILGKISTREMLFFTLYHNLHHATAVELQVQERRAGEAS